MVGWHHRLNGHEFEQALGDGKGQGSLLCCSPQGCKELDTMQRLNNNIETESRMALARAGGGEDGELQLVGRVSIQEDAKSSRDEER